MTEPNVPLQWIMLHERMSPEMLGFLPAWLSERDERSAVEQIDANYRHGGGWRDFEGFTVDKETGIMTYPGDPELRPLAMTKMRDETVYFYQSSWVTVVDGVGKVRTARID